MSNNEITKQSYWNEINSLAESIASEAMADNNNDRQDAEDDINDSRLHETIDEHQWIIYNAYNLDVLKYSDNEDYYIDNFGAEDAGHTLKERGIDGLHTAMLFWAMYADVQNLISDKLDKIEEAVTEKEETINE